MIPRSPVLYIMTSAARKASKVLVRDFGEIELLQVSEKGTSDFLATANLRTERILRKELGRARPDFGFLFNKTETQIGKDPDNRWIVAPIDGTINFLHGIPHFAISIALENQGEILASVIYNPVQDELYFAEKGQGAFLNDRRLRVSARNRLSEAVIATGCPQHERSQHSTYLGQLGVVMESSRSIRSMGSVSLDLAYVAAGRCEAFWDISLEPWEVAAGILLVREAGGFVAEIDGTSDPISTGSILATNSRLYQPMVELLHH